MEWSRMGRFWCPCKKSIIFLNFSTKIIWMNWQRLEEENPTPWERERAVPSQVSAIILSHYGQIGWFSVWEALWKSCPCGCGGRWWSVQPTRCWSPDWSYCCRAHSGKKIEYKIFASLTSIFSYNFINQLYMGHCNELKEYWVPQLVT